MRVRFDFPETPQMLPQKDTLITSSDMQKCKQPLKVDGRQRFFNSDQFPTSSFVQELSNAQSS